MKVLIFSGTHSRHAFFHECILKNFNVCGAVVMERESTILGDSIKGQKNKKTEDWNIQDQTLYNYHFSKRNEIEKEYYQNKNTDLYYKYCDVLKVSPNELNSEKVEQFIKHKNPDLCFIFGTNIIKDNIVNIMPKWKINLHLGLSPWYRGSATLFWPFYNLQPQFAGSTFHQIIQEPDAGNILHQTVPDLEYGDSLHEVAAKVVVSSSKDVVHLLRKIEKGEEIQLHKQKNSGKNWLIRDFEPHHLRQIYNLYEDKIVDEWLNGNLGDRIPKTIKGF